MVIVKCEVFKNYSVLEVTTAKKGLGILEEALNDDLFHRMIIDAKYANTADYGEIILKRILSGADRYDRNEDTTLNCELEMYSRWWSRVVGYVLNGSRRIYTNRKYFSTSVNCASNIIHEYCHLLGYDHRSASDSQSVPYKINSLFEIWAHNKGCK